jgi:acyl transferase domain-containing protein/acyl carrier protein
MDPQSKKIAIVGMSGRFPGAPNVATFWRALVAGEELIQHFTDEELLLSGVEPRLLEQPHYIRSRPILGDVSQFDADFFGMSARDAEVTDPQLRLLLECSWEALEESGHAPPAYTGTVGIYAGLRLSRYLDEHLLPNKEIVDAMGRDYLMMINRKDSAATWVAYRLNLKGPAISINTACSTSLVTVHLAANALTNFECDVALAGAAAIPCFGKEGYISRADGPWSQDGHCRPFDEQASGTLEGAGCAVVALKRLEDARADGDVIHGVLLGSSVNNDGRNKIGYSAPGIDGQAKVIEEAMAVAGVTANDIGYVETHGTATPLGDPIEIAALTEAYRQTTSRVADCPIGSVKSNVGHLGVAAGITGLIKVALSLKNQQIPPSLHCQVPNPAIDFQNSPFFVNTVLRSWPRSAVARRGAVSSFGIGGTNAHVVLEEAPQPTEVRSSRHYFILPVSGRCPAATESGLRRLADHLAQNREVPLSFVSATLRTARPAFSCRRAIVAADVDTAIARLLVAAETFTESCAPGLPVVDAHGRITAHVEDDEADLNELAQLWELGSNVDWKAFDQSEKMPRVTLPAYSFVRRRYWADRPGGNTSDVLSNSRRLERVNADYLPAETALATTCEVDTDGSEWDVIVVSSATPEALAEGEQLARENDKPLVMVLPEPPYPIPTGFLRLDLPEGDQSRRQQLVDAVLRLGYKRILLIDGTEQIPTQTSQLAQLTDTLAFNLAERVSRIWAATLGEVTILPDSNFFDLGGDSLVALQMVSQLNVEFGIDLRPVELISAPTVSALTERIAQELLAGLDQATLDSMIADCEDGTVKPASLQSQPEW